jgi:hypothetical protein
MSASIWLPIIAGVLVVFGLLMVGAVVGGFLVWRYGRRKVRAIRSHGLVVAATALWEATSSVRPRWLLPVGADAAGRRSARSVRREMWRAVDRGERAVRAATGVGAPTASLPTLSRRLREAAIGLDQLLRVEPAGAVPPEVARQAAEIVRAAGDLQRAAVASASDATGQQVTDAVADADQEIRLLHSGLASARVALARSDRSR